MSKTTVPPVLLSPTDAAARIGVTVAELVAWVRRHRYEFTARAVGGKPGDRGRNRWGLTEAQLTAVLRGQARRFEEPKPETTADAPRVSAASPDGKSRLRKGRGARL